MGTPTRVTIQDEDGRTLARCAGPAPDGSCPSAAAGQPVRCAGHRVLPDVETGRSMGRAGWQMRVEPAATRCPLAAGARVWVKVPGRRWGPADSVA